MVEKNRCKEVKIYMVVGKIVRVQAMRESYEEVIEKTAQEAIKQNVGL